MQINLFANQTQFSLVIADSAVDGLNVLQFSSEQLALSRSYTFDISICCYTALDPALLLGKQATLTIFSDTDPIYRHGLVEQCNYLGKNTDQQNHLYKINLVSILEKLKQRQSNRLFLQKTVLEIVQEILLDAHWHTNAFAFQVTRDYPARALTVQYNETDLAFIERLLNADGLFYYFNQQQENSKLIIQDNLQTLPVFAKHQLAYVNESGSYRPHATIYDFQECAMQQALNEQRQVFIAKTDCRELQLGQSFALTNHPVDGYNSNYRVIELQINADQTAGITPVDAIVRTYEAVCILYKADQNYFSLEKPKPYFPYLFAANIQSYDRHVPYLDENGCYYAQLSFDQTSKTTVQTSPPLKLLQTHSSEQREQKTPVGMHYPLRKDTQTAIGFMHGDLEQPLILGAIHNSENPSTSNDNNQMQNSVRSHSGNEILIDDHEEQPMLRFATKNHNNYISLQAPEENHLIHFNAVDGEFASYAKKNLTIETNGDYQQQSETNHIIQVQKRQHLLSKQSSIQHQSGAHLSLKSHKELQAESENAGNIKAINNMVLNADQLIELQNHKGNLTATARAGNIIMQSQHHLCIRGSVLSEVKAGQPGGGLTASSSGNVYFTGSQQCLEAPEINVFGSVVG
jgi:type VI secretion system secreted protein VgrG